MSNNEEKIINNDKPAKVGKSINIEDKLTQKNLAYRHGQWT
jgi:hypothetical protein